MLHRLGCFVKNKTHQNVRGSREVLHEALLSLVVEQPYESITVKQILDRAGVGRTTFYKHFSDKEELLFSGLEPLRGSLIRGSTSAPDSKCSTMLQFAGDFFREGERVLEAYKALSNTAAGTVARNCLYSMLVDVIREGLRVRSAGHRAEFLDAPAHWLAGSIMGLVEWWTQQTAPLSGAQMERIFLSLSNPALDAIFS